MFFKLEKRKWSSRHSWTNFPLCVEIVFFYNNNNNNDDDEDHGGHESCGALYFWVNAFLYVHFVCLLPPLFSHSFSELFETGSTWTTSMSLGKKTRKQKEMERKHKPEKAQNNFSFSFKRIETYYRMQYAQKNTCIVYLDELCKNSRAMSSCVRTSLLWYAISKRHAVAWLTTARHSALFNLCSTTFSNVQKKIRKSTKKIK